MEVDLRVVEARPATFSQKRIQQETGLKEWKDPAKIIVKHLSRMSEAKERHISGVLNQGSPYQAVTGKIYRLWELLLPPANAQKS